MTNIAVPFARQIQWQRLSQLLLKDDSILPHSIFCYGSSSTGKTLLLKQLTALPLRRWCYLDAIEYGHSQKQFLSEWARQLVHENETVICDNWIKLIGLLPSTPIIIIIDHADRLNPALLSSILRLSVTTSNSLTVILASQWTFDKFQSNLLGVDLIPLMIPFPDYTKQEALTILSGDMKEEQQLGLYRQLSTLVYDILAPVSLDILALRQITAQLFPIYVEPIEKGLVQRHETGKLYRAIQPILKDRILQGYVAPLPVSSTALPKWSYFLVCAAYMASYNPTTVDMKLFSNTATKKRGGATRLKRKPSKHDKPKQQLLGPRVFALERWLAIFHALLPFPIPGTVTLYQQITSLVTMGWMMRVSRPEKLEEMRFRCHLSYETVNALGKEVGLDVGKYLYDFW